MKDFCPFLEDDPLIEGKCYAVGVNFLNVGTKNSVSDLFNKYFHDLPFRSSVEVYTDFHNFPEVSFIDVGFVCLANDL